MYRLILFFRKYYAVLLFILLEAGAISYYAHATSYTRATLLAASNRATAGLHEGFASVGDYFTLRRDNLRLLDRIAELESRQADMLPAADSLAIDSLTASSPYFYTTARVISNSIARQENFFIIDKGLRDGIEENMGVLTPDGAVAGYVRQCSDKYTVCVSVLNRAFSIGGRFLHNEYFGSVGWDGTDPRFVTLTDIPRYAEVAVGDTVVSAYSLRFPADRFIGTVAGISSSEDGTTHVIRLRLGARMHALSHVVLVRFADYDELDQLAGSYFTDTATPTSH